MSVPDNKRYAGRRVESVNLDQLAVLHICGLLGWPASEF